jgi:tetratricopeptide (TPR) repeat protein
LDEIEAAYLHEDVGKALEALYGNQADEIAVQLARHFELAEIPEKARHYLQIAGEQVAAVYANEQGISYFSRALNLTPDSEHEARYALLSAREKLYDLLGDRESQRADLDILEGLADSSGGPEWQAEVAARVANYAVDTSDYPQAITAAEKAVALAQEAGISTIVVDAYNLWSGALWMRGEYEAARFPAERSLALAREISDLRGESQALNHLGVITWKQGDISAAKSYLKQKLSITRQIGDRPEEARSLNNLGAIAGRQGDFPEARSYFEQCLDISREIGHQTAVAYAMGNLGEINSGLGDYAAARPYLEQALGLTRESGERRMESTVLLRLAELAAELQDHDAALNYGEQSLSIVREIGDREYEPRVLSFLGYMALEECNHANANASFLQALEIYRSIGRHHMIPGALAGLARVALTVGDTPKGLAHVEEILDFLADGSQLVTEIEPFRVYLICYQVLQAVRDARANTILETAYNLLQEQAEKIPEAEERRMFLEKVSHNRELIATYNETR